MKKNVYSLCSLILLLPSMVLIPGCGKSKNRSTVTNVTSETRPSLLPAEQVKENVNNGNLKTSSTKAISSTVTFSKSELLSQVFLYGADIQYSAIDDEKYDLTLQSMSIGHFPASFKIVGNSLQLIADQRLKFESDINHPGRLIQEFVILSQDEESVSVLIDKASPILSTIVTDAKAGAPRQSWVRSVEFVPEGNYLLLETTVEGADGTIVEFMESLFPQSTIVPENYKPILNDPDLEPNAERFRLLSDGKVFLDIPEEGRVQTQVANRFHLKDNKIIEWYVTPNVPETYIPQVKAGVEGWNRYSQAMWGRDFVKFMGILPAGVKLGDPRYNVINWDNVADAGAAYESQATDPTTGIQSHSLIYLPLAWINIGKEYWGRGYYSDDDSSDISKTKALKDKLAKTHVMGRKISVECLDEAIQHLSAEARLDPELFARELLKGTLFHEVGHALGLAHNFKGSLSFEPDNAETKFSTSIMDYNHYTLERAAFESVESDKGPLLEYDRQIISLLYNEGKDIKESDPVLPACDDDEADSFEGGVDPLCLRYDAGKDPTQQMQKAVALITDPATKSERTQSLPHAILDAVKSLPDASSIDNADKVKSEISKLSKSVAGLVNFYVASGANSVNYLTRANTKSLFIFQEDVLLEGYDEAQMRERALNGVKYATSLRSLPTASAEALTEVAKQTREWLGKTTYISGLPEEQRAETIENLLKPLVTVWDNKSNSQVDKFLAKLRTQVMSTLKRNLEAPFFFSVSSEGVIDVEAEMITLLKTAAIAASDDSFRTMGEREVAVSSLLTFKDIPEGKAALEKVGNSLKEELSTVKTAVAREKLRTLIRQISG